MARDYANIQTSIWGNPDVRALPPMQQWLYLQMWTHPDLTYAGVLDWRPGKNLAPLSEGTSAQEIRDLIPLLQERRFVVLDEDTEEILLRSYFRHDGLLKNPSTAVSMANAYASTGSNMIRGVTIHELLRLREEHPDWKGWTLSQVVSIMKHPAVDPLSIPGFGPSSAGRVTPLIAPKPAPEVAPRSTTTATTTATEASLLADAGEAKLKESRLPKSWAPTPAHFALAKERSIDIAAEADAFRLHAETHDRHAARWNAAFTTWLKKARPSTAAAGSDSWAGLRRFGDS